MTLVMRKSSTSTSSSGRMAAIPGGCATRTTRVTLPQCPHLLATVGAGAACLMATTARFF